MYPIIRRVLAVSLAAAILAIGSCIDGGRVCTVPTPDGETWTTERRSADCARLYKTLDSLTARDPGGDVVIQ